MKNYATALMMSLVLALTSNQMYSQEQYPKVSLNSNGDTIISITKDQFDSTLVRLIEGKELAKRNKALKEANKSYESANVACDSLIGNLNAKIASKDVVIEETRLMLEDQKKVNFSDLYTDTKTKLDESDKKLTRSRKWVKRLGVSTASLALYIVGREYLIKEKARN